MVLYAGTFGRANDMPTVVAAAERLVAADPAITWLFLGHGYYQPLVATAATRWPASTRTPRRTRSRSCRVAPS